MGWEADVWIGGGPNFEMMDDTRVAMNEEVALLLSSASSRVYVHGGSLSVDGLWGGAGIP